MHRRFRKRFVIVSLVVHASLFLAHPVCQPDAPEPSPRPIRVSVLAQTPKGSTPSVASSAPGSASQHQNLRDAPINRPVEEPENSLALRPLLLEPERAEPPDPKADTSRADAIASPALTDDPAAARSDPAKRLETSSPLETARVGMEVAAEPVPTLAAGPAMPRAAPSLDLGRLQARLGRMGGSGAKSVAAEPREPATLLRRPSQRQPHPIQNLPESDLHRGRDSRIAEDYAEQLAMIRARIRRIVPIAFENVRRHDLFGTTWVAMLLTRAGYVDRFRILRTSGRPELDHAARGVVHLAEPYPYVPGWVDVEVEFR